MFGKKHYNQGFEDAMKISGENVRELQETNAFKSPFRKKDKIKIVYKDKKGMEFSEKLRKYLNDGGFVSHVKTYSDYRTSVTSRVDYTIFLKNIEEYNLEHYKKVLNEAGCQIYVNDNGNIILDYHDNIGMSIDEFKKYYSKTVHKYGRKKYIEEQWKDDLEKEMALKKVKSKTIIKAQENILIIKLYSYLK